MNTVTLWLLISIGNGMYAGGAVPTQVVERFATVQECQRVAEWMRGNVDSFGRFGPRVGCIQAAVVRND